jgi:TRAP-type C4-dicarboxylate transport system substrate-binding protein
MKKLFLVVSMALAASTLIIGGCAEPAPAPAPQKQIVLKLVAFHPDVLPSKIWTTMFIDKVKAKSNDQLIIEYVGGPEVIPVPEQPAAVQKGAVDIANCVYTFTPAPATAVECLGYSEVDYGEWRKSGAYDLAQELLNKVNIYFLGHGFPTGVNRAGLYFSNVKIEKPEDFAGLKVGCPGADTVGIVEALGGSPVPINYTDFYTAMERGVLDAYFFATSGVTDFSLQDVTKYMIDERFSCGGSPLYINLDKWNSLPKNLQDVMNEAAIELEQEGKIEYEKVDAASVKKIQEAGTQIIKFSPADSKRFHTILTDALWKQFIERYPEYGPKFKALIAP